MKKKKVLIAIVDAGNGHKSAANAISLVFESKYKDKFEVKIIDLFELADVDPFNSSKSSYEFVSRNRFLESVNNFFFQILNTAYTYPLFYKYTLWRMRDECREIINYESPDIVISVHPIVSTVLRGLKLESNSFKSVVVITDLVTLFRGWADTSADIVFSPTEEAIPILQEMGVSKKRIKGPLFPVDPKMSYPANRNTILEDLKFSNSLPIILLTAGGVGSKTLSKAIESLIKKDKYQIIIIAGKLESFRSELESKYKGNKKVKVLGYVNNMQDYISIADLVIGKPGPATIIESELFNKKMILTRKVGHQETGNIGYALKNPKFRYIGENWGKLEVVINELLETETPSSTKREFNETEKIVEEILKLV